LDRPSLRKNSSNATNSGFYIQGLKSDEASLVSFYFISVYLLYDVKKKKVFFLTEEEKNHSFKKYFLKSNL
jgi:hypothetical protein